MREEMPSLDRSEARQLWATLGAEGKAPTELTRAAHLLPSYSVGVEQWVDRLSAEYLQDLCRQYAHFKVVLAPYGGGKTHFLMVLGSKALAENYAVAYVPCGPSVTLDKPLDIYRECVKHLQLPGDEYPGLQRLLARIVEVKREQIEQAQAPDPNYAFGQWVLKVSKHPYPDNAFGRVVAEALRYEWDSTQATVGEAAIRWLQGEIDTLTKDELASLRLAKVPNSSRNQLGQNLLMSLIQFSKEAGVNGVVLLFDEVETLFSARGKALLRVLSAMRVLVDLPAGIPGGCPMLGVFSAVPDVLEQLSHYPALEQRLKVSGSPFEEGNNHAPQLKLEKIESQNQLLSNIGKRLINLGKTATGHEFDLKIQSQNAELLSKVASTMNLEVNARRLFVKTWVNILDLQARDGERLFAEKEFLVRYRGFFDELKSAEQDGDEP